MSTRRDTSIRFRCPRCITSLRARAGRAGHKLRCPCCHMLLLVPLESTKPAAGGEYPLCEAADEPGGPPPRYIAVTCGVCGTRISAGQEQAGQQVACPDCGTPCLVVLPVEADAVEAAAGRPVEEYAIREDGGDSAGGARIEEALIPVFCPLCHTLMQTPESLVGQQITCPDCGTATVVARPKVDKPKHQEQEFRTAPDEEYAVSEDEAPQEATGHEQAPAAAGPTLARPAAPPPAARPKPELYAVLCPQCNTRLHATPDQAGSRLKCPDCGTRFPVPPPPPKEPKLRIEKADPYDVRYEAEAPGLARQADPMFFSPSSFRNVEAAGKARPRLPRWPLLTGVLLFLAYRQAIIRWIVLSVVLAIVLLLAGGAVTLTPPALPAGNRGSALVGAAGTNILQLIMTAAAVVLGAMWGVAASINLLAIAQDTSSGNDEIENWPEEVFLDWFPNAFFVIDSFLLSVVPGVAIVWFRPELAGAGVLLVLSSLLFLFPIALLSMSEAGSPLLPFSARVLRSLVRCPGTWLMFYFETGLLVFAAVLGLASLLFGGVLMLLPVSALLVLVMMLYFRLLGRLAWACGSSAADADDRQPA